MKSCTICLEEGEDVTNYCTCTKSVAAYHRECLREYVKKTGVRRCGFCKEEYKNMSSAFAESDYVDKVLMCMMYYIRVILLGIMMINQYSGNETTPLAVFLFVITYMLTGCVEMMIEIKTDARIVANQ